MRREERAQLTHPLSDRQIAIAAKLHSRLTLWVATADALALLRSRVRGFDLPACLLKVTTVNDLYGTNVLATARMAAHVAKIMKRPKRKDLVEALSALPAVRGQKQPRKHISFASKFAHFFVSADAYPIYDSYAVEMLRYHLGPLYERDKTRPYQTFCRNLERLRLESGIRCSSRELDQYLWLCGLSRAWKESRANRINRRAKDLFQSQFKNRSVRRELQALHG